MYTDDSRGLESPDRSHAPTEPTDTRALPDGGTDEYRHRLKVIDRQARKLLETIANDSDATRHCREIRAEVECVRRELLEFESDDLENEPATDVPMIVDRGEAVTTYLGPDPDAYVREHGDRDD